MKITTFLLLILFLFSCNRHSSQEIEINHENEILTEEAAPNNTGENLAEGTASDHEEELLIIGGKPIRDYDSFQYYKKNNIENIDEVNISIDTNGQIERYAINLDGIEQLLNIQYLNMYGRGLDTLDFSLLNHLKKLKHIRFEGVSIEDGRSPDYYRLTKIPDLRNLDAANSITSMHFISCALTSMDNIDFMPNLRILLVKGNADNLADTKALSKLHNLETLEISSFWLEGDSVFRLEDISSLTKLTTLKAYFDTIDLKGIENLKSLNLIRFDESNLVNTKFLAGLENLKYLSITIRDAVPDIRFLEGMKDLEALSIYADDQTWGNQTKEPYQVLDISSMKNLSKLEYLELRGFILKNISSLDSLDHLIEARVTDSFFDDNTEHTEKKMIQVDDR